jgi:hypothetical protein
MTKKRLLMIASLPLAVAGTFGVLAMLPPRIGVTKTNLDRIQEGTNRADVEQIFGAKPHLATHDYNYQPVKMETGWSGPGGRAYVVLDADDCVREKRWEDTGETLFAKIRRWLRID